MKWQPGKKFYAVTTAVALVLTAASAYGSYELGRWGGDMYPSDTYLARDFETMTQMISVAQAQDAEAVAQLIVRDLNDDLQKLQAFGPEAVSLKPDERARLERALDGASKLALSPETARQLATARQTLSSL